MKWYEREYGIEGQPYRYFLADVVWSAVAVALMAFVMILMQASLPALAGACTVVALLLARTIVRRIAQERAMWARAPGRRPGFPPLTTSRTLPGT